MSNQTDRLSDESDENRSEVSNARLCTQLPLGSEIRHHNYWDKTQTSNVFYSVMETIQLPNA